MEKNWGDTPSATLRFCLEEYIGYLSTWKCVKPKYVDYLILFTFYYI